MKNKQDYLRKHNVPFCILPNGGVSVNVADLEKRKINMREWIDVMKNDPSPPLSPPYSQYILK